jgi:GWxTD domain-containing protein
MTVSRIKNAALWVCFALLLSGCSSLSRPDLDPESQSFYETARLIMTKEESRIFTHLPDAGSREEFIQDFWDKRDPDRSTEMNEFQDEFYRRVDYAGQRFREGMPGWKTDRGRMYIYFGPADKIDRYPVMDNPDVKGMEIWYYYGYGFALRFLDEDGVGAYTLDPYYGIAGDFFNAVEQVKLGMLPGLDQRFQSQFVDFEAEYLPLEKKVRIVFPAAAVVFTARESSLQADFGVELYIYTRSGQKIQRFRREFHYEKPESEVARLEEIVFDVPLELGQGKYTLDITLDGSGLSKSRKIFEITHK